MKKSTFSSYFNFLSQSKFAFVIFLVTLFTFNAGAQSMWTGNIDTSWDTPGNWTPSGVPLPTTNVVIQDVANNPVITLSTSVARSVTVNSGGVLTINSGGKLTINGATTQGILNNGTINNGGALDLGSVSSVGQTGIRNRSIFNNNSGGTINVQRAPTYGIFCDTVGVFTNAGNLTLGSSTSAITILLGGEGTFSNNTGGTLNGTGLILVKTHTNNGGTLSPGYSPGKMSFFSKQNFNNSTLNIEINGKAIAGTHFDQVVVSDTVTFGGTLALTVNFPAAVNGDEIPIVASNGRKDTFDVITGLPANWFVIYRNTGAFARFGALTETAWIGDSSTVWSDADNWSNGVPTALSDIFIDDTSTYYPILTTTGIGKSLTIKAGGTLTLSSAGVLNIQGSNDYGIKNSGTIQNSGNINIGTSLAPGSIGVHNLATFNNKTGATVKINRSTSFGLYNSSGTFINESVLEIGGLAGVGSTGIWNASTLSNSTGGQIKIDGSTEGALFNDSLSVFTNSASIILGGVSNVGNFGIRNKASFTNSATGTITVNRTSSYAIYHSSNVFNNSGIITVGSTLSIGNYGIVTLAVFNNNTGSQINIDRAVQAGIINYTTAFTNQGSIKIGALAPIATLIAGTTGSFTNSTGGTIFGTGSIASVIFANAGGTLSPGYSPGILTFTASENFTSNILNIELNGNGTAGVNFDRLAVTGTATLGGTLNLTIPYGGAPGDQIQIVTATSISGTFATVTGLPATWTLVYSSTAVTLNFITAGSTTWTGITSSVWTLAGNWSAGVPIASSDVIIPDVSTNDPIISTAIAVKSVNVNTGGILNITAAGTLTVNGASTQGILNDGSISNGGTVTLGPTSSNGTSGLKNNGTFTNSAGASLLVNNAITNAIENSGTLNNNGTITIGGILNPGQYGLKITGTLTNSGTINIDRTTLAAMHVVSPGNFTNSGNVNLGSSFGIGNQGILNNATILANSSGQISINRSTVAAIENTSMFTNSGPLNIGSLANSGNDGIRNSGTFINTVSTSIGVNRVGDASVNNEVGGTFTNNGTITAGASMSAGQYGVWNSASFTNNGTITINNSTLYGLWNLTGTFNNNATINVGLTNSIGSYAVYNNGLFNNVSGATLSLARSSDAGIYNYGVGVFNNNATLNIGASASVGNYGIRNIAFFNNNAGVINIDNAVNSGIYSDNDIFKNLSTINIGATTSTGLYGIRNRDVFENHGGQITINRATSAGVFSEAGTIDNKATVVIGNLVATPDLLKGTSGSLDNGTGGVFKGTGTVVSNYFSSEGGRIAPGYSPGIMTFTGNTEINNGIVSIEVNGKTTAGTDFDRVVVSGTATLSGTLEIFNNFPGAMIGDQIVILTATSVTGTFTSFIGKPANWTVVYNPTNVTLTLGPPLPVELISFDARLEEKSVKLNWKTASETENKGFEVERSTDGKSWRTIGYVKGKGNSQKVESYVLTDNSIMNANSNILYYRLRQIDNNGKITLSDIKLVNIEGLSRLNNSVRIYPNIVTDVVNIQLTALSNDKISGQIVSSNGQIVRDFILNNGYNFVETNLLAPGIYSVIINRESETYISKIIVVK